MEKNLKIVKRACSAIRYFRVASQKSQPVVAYKHCVQNRISVNKLRQLGFISYGNDKGVS